MTQIHSANDGGSRADVIMVETKQEDTLVKSKPRSAMAKHLAFVSIKYYMLFLKFSRRL